jgi:glycosyltransferase involved in cell wall biosynthesis
MRILVISNLYPPYFMGGYELICWDVVQGFRKRGHEVTVFTSTYGVNKALQDGPVYRIFSYRYPLRQYKMWKPLYFFPLLFAERNDWKQFLRFYREVSPDIIYIWNGLGLSYSLLLNIQTLEVPVAFYISEHWLSKIHEEPAPEGFTLYLEPWIGFWKKREKNIVMKAVKKVLGSLLSSWGFVISFTPFPLKEVHYACSMLKEDALHTGLPVENSKVIYSGLNLEDGPFSTLLAEPPRSAGDSLVPLKLLYVGNLLQAKGAHTVVEACAILKSKGIPFSAIIAGKKLDQQYYDILTRRVQEDNLSSYVSFKLDLTREDLINYYKTYHMLIIPSIWREPTGQVILEGMTAGIPILHTGVGGTREILNEGENCLLFSPDNPQKLAEQIIRLVQDRNLYAQLSRGGKQTVQERFNLAKMVLEIEEDFKRILSCKKEAGVR